MGDRFRSRRSRSLGRRTVGAGVVALVAVLVPVGATAAPIDADELLAPSAVTFTVSPSTGLVDLQVVSIDGSGFEPGQEVGIFQCPTGAELENQCRLGPGTATADGSGAISASFQVVRFVYDRLGDHPPVDCAEAGVCEIQVQLHPWGGGVLARTSIQFAPGPLPPAPTASVVPSTDVADGQTVTVSGAHWDPAVGVGIAQCPTALGSNGIWACGTFWTTPASPTGDLVEKAITLQRVLFTPDGIVDCAVPGACAVAVGQSIVVPGYLPRVEVPIVIADTGPVPLPTLTVTPSTGLVDGQEVTVRGSNMLTWTGPPSSAENWLWQCRAGATTFTDCETRRGAALLSGVRPDADGSFTRQVEVVRYLDLDSGRFDCASAPGACELRYRLNDGWADTARASLSFATTYVSGDPTYTG